MGLCRLVHPERPVSSLLDVYVPMVRGKQISPGCSNEICCPPEAVRHGMKRKGRNSIVPHEDMRQSAAHPWNEILTRAERKRDFIRRTP